ncbi:MAG: hypothetical protein CO118_10235 [Flavobacteriales bacterium CG_4_9_14_3_um_filter_32_8]|nr:MAG: hypothetical protein CO118_10235 [Flavobacteriales bacterium CG_4_9_14_3_um_filter_32_8]
MKTTIVLFLTWVLSLPLAFAQSSLLDLSFDPGTGANAAIWASALQSDGKIIIGGDFTTFNGVPSDRMARLNADGSLDNSFTSFNPNGVLGIRGLTIQPDGKIIITGDFTTYDGIPINRVARLLPDGNLDNFGTFSSSGGANALVRALAVQPDSNIVIGGNFTTFDGISFPHIARLNPFGGIDASFNPGNGTDGGVSAIAIQPDGKIIIGGSFNTYNTINSRKNIARINADGTLDISFNPGTGTDISISSITIQPDGKIIIGGGFTSYNGVTINRIARLNADGSLDTTFNPGSGVDGVVYTTSIQSDGKIIIGGFFTTYNGIASNRIVRVNSDGTLDTSFNSGSGASSEVRTTILQSDGKVIIGGGFTTFDGIAINRVARLLKCTPPTVTANATATTICFGDAVTLTGSGTAVSYNWDNGVTNGIAFNPTNTTIYTVTGTTGSCSNTDQITVTVNPAIDVSTNLVGNIISANQTSATYQWVDCNNGNAPIIGETNQSFTPSANGDYAVEITVGSCVSTSLCVNITITGVDNITSVGISSYPNPIKDKLTITMDKIDNYTHVSILNMNGQLVYSNNNVTNKLLIIDANKWSSGMYIMNIMNGNDSKIFKLIKQ